MSRLLTVTFTTAAFVRSSFRQFEASPLQSGSEGPTFISRTAQRFRVFLTQPLSEPCLNVSAHTAPAMEPRRTPICQCAHNFGSRLEIRATQCVALRK